MQKELSQLSGAGIRIGIIDSGYTPSSRHANVINGINLVEKESCLQADYTDRIGHGTACAGIIAKIAPEAELYSVKIFDQELVSDGDTLCAGIYWCVENGIKIVNLSLGTTDKDGVEQLKEACDFARDQNVIIVAAASNEGLESYPASYPTVFGVEAGKVRGNYDYYFDPSRPVQFIARGDRQRLDWIDGKQVFMGGTSFAAPYATALISLLLQRYPEISLDELEQKLKQHSLPHPPPLIDGKQLYSFPGATNSHSKPCIRLSDIYQQNDVRWIKKAVVFPYNKEMHSLIRFQDLLPFQIVHVVDVVGKRMIGKDSGEAIGAEPSGIVIQKNLEKCLLDCDTLILGHIDELGRIQKRDLLRETLELALRCNKNVYSLEPVTQERYPNLVAAFDKKNLHLNSPVITFSEFESMTRAFDWREKSQKPVVGVFGTSPQQGKFTTQLALRQELQKAGYKVGQLGTEHQSTLFGFDFTFPNGYGSRQNVQIPMDLHIPLLQSAMVGIEREDPHIVIVGGQSGLIPYNYSEKSPAYTLPSLVLLMGTLPDAYILVVNSIDDMDFIQANIDVLKAIGKGETILLVFSDKTKGVQGRIGKSYIGQEPLTVEEINEITNSFEHQFCIPATEIISEAGRQKMVLAVEDFFENDSRNQ